jgi:sugar/nucleoside kinase (ribokinase family)
MSQYEIVVAGHLCLDISPAFDDRQPSRVEELFRPGRLINIAGAVISSGGPVSNTGFALARLGLRVLPVANIGDDEFGAMLGVIARKETGFDVKKTPGVPTSYSIILSPPGIDRIILHDPAGNNLFTSGDIDYGIVGETGYFHFGYPPLLKKIYANGGEELVRVYQQAKAAGAVTSLDMSLPDPASESWHVGWKDILSRTLPFVDIFMPSIEEALLMLDMPEYERIMGLCGGDDFTKYLDFAKVRELGSTILQMGARIAFIKCGANGVYIKTADAARMAEIGKEAWAGREMFQPTYVVENFKSALAGGDTTIAGFLAGMIRGFSLEDCARIACKTGALCCTTYDSISGLLPLPDVFALTKTQPAKNSTSLPKGHLRYDASQEMYTT